MCDLKVTTLPKKGVWSSGGYDAAVRSFFVAPFRRDDPPPPARP